MFKHKITLRQLIAGAPMLAVQAPSQRRPKIAAIVTIYHKFAHAQHICDRFLMGYGWNGVHHKPAMELVSLWVDQVKDNDLSRSCASEFPIMKIYPTIAEALTLGTGKLAVDGVLLIGEHGDYPDNEKGQKKYPRYEFFREIVKVFESSGRAVPMFNDKHLPGTGTGHSTCITPAAGCAFRSWPDRACPSPGARRRSTCQRVRRCARLSVCLEVGSTAETFAP